MMHTPAIQTVVRPAVVLTIAGTPTNIQNFDATFNAFGSAPASASITIPLPLPDYLRGWVTAGFGEGPYGDMPFGLGTETYDEYATLNAPVELKAGFAHEGLRTRFIGNIDKKSFTFDTQNQEVTFTAYAQSRRLAWAEERDLFFEGPIALHDIVRSLCTWRGMRMVRVDDITDVHGNTIMLGGNLLIDDGRVKIPRRTSPLSWINRKCQLFGYRAFDTPSGEFRVQAIIGTPTIDEHFSFSQGVNVYDWRWSWDVSPMANYIRVDGPTYTDEDGVSIPIISFPEAPPAASLLSPPGWRAHPESDNDLVTNALADAVRAAQEINLGSPYQEGTVNTHGHNTLQPGNVMRIHAPGVEKQGKVWITGVRDYIDTPGGYNCTITGWSADGTVLPGGDDAEFVDVRLAPIHLGDEYVSWYAMPSPAGHEYTFTITVPDEYTSIAISMMAHGANSHMLDGVNHESTVSKIVVSQNGEEVGSAELPVLPEDYELRRDYTNIENWTRVRMPVPGRLEAGTAEVKIASGEHTSLPWNFRFDDFEVRDIVIELRGRVFPVLPGGG